MKIRGIDARYYRLPLRSRLEDSTHGVLSSFEVVIVTITTDEGPRGTGYTYTVGRGGKAILALIREDIAPLLIGQDPSRIESIWDTLWWSLHYVGRGGPVSFAISAVDIALWDLRGIAAGEPLWKSVGGFGDSVRSYSGGVDLNLETPELIGKVQAAVRRGFPAVKIKAGRPDLGEDIERVRAVRAAIGPEVLLMVDANMRWTVDTAILASRAFADSGVYWLEEPTIPDDVPGHARILAEGPTPVAAGENLHTIYEFRAMIENHAVSFPEPDVSNVGGVTGWLRVARLAYAFNLPVTTHGVHELHVHLLAGIPNSSFLEVHGFGLERYILEPPAFEGGRMIAPSRPGHGVEFDDDALRSGALDTVP